MWGSLSSPNCYGWGVGADMYVKVKKLMEANMISASCISALCVAMRFETIAA